MCCDDIKFALKSVVAVHPTVFTGGHCGSSTTMKDLVRRIYTDWLLRPVRLIA